MGTQEVIQNRGVEGIRMNQQNVLDLPLAELCGGLAGPGQTRLGGLEIHVLHPPDRWTVLSGNAARVGIAPLPVLDIDGHGRNAIASRHEPPPDGGSLLGRLALVEIRIAEELFRLRRETTEKRLVPFDVGHELAPAHPIEIEMGPGVVAEEEPALLPGEKDALELRVVVQLS